MKPRLKWDWNAEQWLAVVGQPMGAFSLAFKYSIAFSKHKLALTNIGG